MHSGKKNLNLISILKLWCILTIILLTVSVIALVNNTEFNAFIILLCTINIVLLGVFAIFIGKIQKYLDSLIGKASNIIIEIDDILERKIGILIISLLLLFISYVFYLITFDVDAYFILIDEDRFVEYSSALFWFLSSICMLKFIIKSSRANVPRWCMSASFLIMLFFIVCGGEEISWGQRFLGIETPEIIKAVNVQNEITIHNLGSISVFMNVFFLVTIVFFFVIPATVNKYPQFSKLVHLVYFPVASKYSVYVYFVSFIAWICVGIRFGTLGFHPFSFYSEQYYTQMDDEIFEFFAAYSFFTFSLINSLKKISHKNGNPLTK